jgi:hypothetical protein
MFGSILSFPMLKDSKTSYASQFCDICVKAKTIAKALSKS